MTIMMTTRTIICRTPFYFQLDFNSFVVCYVKILEQIKIDRWIQYYQTRSVGLILLIQTARVSVLFVSDNQEDMIMTMMTIIIIVILIKG